MKNKSLKIAIVGKTNAGKSTLINNIVKEKISIQNKKINTTEKSILGVLNVNNTQLLFYDTPGFSLIKSKNDREKKFKSQIWETISRCDIILYLLDIKKYTFKNTIKDLIKLKEENKPIILVFNKNDLIIKKNIILKYISEINSENIIIDFFNISSKNMIGIDLIIKYLISKSKHRQWEYVNDEISDKDDIFISNECTRNSILKFIHKEIPYNIKVRNKIFRILKNKDIKIKQIIQISNSRYKPIILGNKGEIIKKIRLESQKEITKIFNAKIHLYLEIEDYNVK